MLRLTLHGGTPATLSRYNALAWLDIGYEKLAPVADYKAVLFEHGRGATMPFELKGYPRWSASLWDLVARALALGMTSANEGGKAAETLAEPEWTRKSSAYATAVYAELSHFPAGKEQYRRVLGTAHLTQVGRKRGTYVARFEEHTRPTVTTPSFEFKADRLRYPHLLYRACAIALTGTQELPPRPGLCVPDAIEVSGVRFVPIHMLVEPARTGFQHWLSWYSELPLQHPGARLGIAPETLYAKFLQEAV